MGTELMRSPVGDANIFHLGMSYFKHTSAHHYISLCIKMSLIAIFSKRGRHDLKEGGCRPCRHYITSPLAMRYG